MQQTPWQSLDFLSPFVRSALGTNEATAYGQLVVHQATPAASRDLLGRLRPEDLITVPVKDAAHLRAMLAGLWLWHDGLAESHEISQALPSATGSYWHAIMHRREGDFSNAKYWYARCRHHPVLEDVAAEVRSSAGTGRDKDSLLHQVTDHGWDPDGFVDVVEAVHRKSDDPLHAAAVRLQRLEWNALFAHCARQAAGR